MHFFGLVMYNGDEIKFSFELSWFKILCANDWSKRFLKSKILISRMDQRFCFKSKTKKH
jgi:hypothetical protein